MFKHFIIMSSSYSLGTRIALHYVIDEHMNADMLKEEVKTIKRLCGETVSISTHYIETEYPEWNSVIEKDGFFEDVQVVDSLVGFVNMISEDRELQGIDIAKYILSVQRCTHLELEKLVYLCYAEYLCATKKRLFKDKIYAFKYGPVIKSVYESYKGMKEIEDGEINDKNLEKDYAKMPARSRILFAEDGINKIAWIEATLKKFRGFSAFDLVNITHVKGGPWDSTEKSVTFAEITDKVILEKHFKEVALIQ